MPPALLSKPESKQDYSFYMESFLFLSQFRGSGMSGPLPLSFLDVKGYAGTVGLGTTEAVLFFSDMMAAMDSIYLMYMAKQMKLQKAKEAQKQKSKRTPSRGRR